MNLLKTKKRLEEDNSQGGAYPFNPSSSFKDNIWNAQLQRREIIINQNIDDSIIEKVTLQIFNINAFDDESLEGLASVGATIIPDRPPIKLYINSGGGNIDEAFSVISAIESSRTPIHTIALGKAFSAAFMILLAGHVRSAQKYSNLMYHQGSAGYVGEFGKHFEYAEYWKKTQEAVEDYVLKRTNIPCQKIDEIFMRKQDWYVTPQEALNLGIIDYILGEENSEPEESKIQEKPKRIRKPKKTESEQ